MMGRRTICAMQLLLMMLAAPLSADQRDPRLRQLFSRLQGSADVAQAEALEQQIWSIWLRTENEKVAELLGAGVHAMGAGRVDEAVSHFSEVVSRSPEFAEGWNKRATALYLRQDFAGSMRDIERTLALEPRHFGAISGMGLILMATGDLMGAMAAFEAVLRINPNAPSAHHYLQQLRRKLAAGGA